MVTFFPGLHYYEVAVTHAPLAQADHFICFGLAANRRLSRKQIVARVTEDMKGRPDLGEWKIRWISFKGVTENLLKKKLARSRPVC